MLTSFGLGVDIKTNRLAAQAKSRYTHFLKVIKSILRVLFIIVTFLFSSFATYAQDTAQCFSNFPAEVFNVEEKPPIKLDSDTENFKTVIEESYKTSSVNFGGHYLIVSWGCGISCQSHALVNFKTGQVKAIPFVTSLGLSFQANSDLLILNPDLDHAKQEQKHLKGETEYYIVENDSLVQLSKSKVPKSCF